jgi:hypothetical protein
MPYPRWHETTYASGRLSVAGEAYLKPQLAQSRAGGDDEQTPTVTAESELAL